MPELTNDEIEALIAGATVASRFRDSVRAHPDRLALRLDLPIDDPHHLFVWAGLHGFVQVRPPSASQPLRIEVLP